MFERYEIAKQNLPQFKELRCLIVNASKQNEKVKHSKISRTKETGSIWLKKCWGWEHFTGLDQFEWMKITKVPEAGGYKALKVAEACHLHAESDRDITDFPYKGNSFSHL